MNMTRMPSKDKVFPYFFCGIAYLLLIFLTNNFYTISDQTTYGAAGDSGNFLIIAGSVPYLPDGSYKMPSHHAERIASPYLVGIISHVFSINFVDSFRLFSILMTLGTILGLVLILRHLDVGWRGCLMAVIFWASCPYTLRYYLAFPAMGSDPMFIFGLSILILGLLKVNLPLLLFANVFMIFARQTTLATLPAVLIWFMADKNWARYSLTARLAFFASIIGVDIGATQFLKWISAHYSIPSRSYLDHLYGIFPWIYDKGLNLQLVIFLIKGLTSISLPLSIVIGALALRRRSISGSTIGILFLFLSLIAQPYLAGPAISQGSISRLNVIGFIPLLVLGFSLIPKQALDKIPIWLMASFAVLSFGYSSHPLVSIQGQWIGGRMFFLGVLGLTILAIFLVAGYFYFKLGRNGKFAATN